MLSAASSIAASAATPVAAACSAATEPWLIEAIATARRHLDRAWLAVGDNLYAAYDLKSPQRNPFDITAKASPTAATPPPETARGYMWVGGLQCLVTRQEPETLVHLSFKAGAVSFSENKAEWTKPLRDTTLTEIVVTRDGAGWKSVEQRGDHAVLLPDEYLRRPTLEEIPAPHAKRKIPCKADQHWNGRRCAAAAPPPTGRSRN
jgi:hypothetical protein